MDQPLFNLNSWNTFIFKMKLHTLMSMKTTSLRIWSQLIIVSLFGTLLITSIWTKIISNQPRKASSTPRNKNTGYNYFIQDKLHHSHHHHRVKPDLRHLKKNHRHGDPHGEHFSSTAYNQQDSINSIDNSTLGFGKIYYINLPDRDIYDDILELQAFISGLKLNRVEAVTPGVLKQSENDTYYFGQRLPTKREAKACFRSHANIWRTIVDSNIDTALILEADSMWDLNIKGMLQVMSRQIEQRVRLHNFNNSDSKPVEYSSESDPYLFRNWDILQLGGCAPQISSKINTVIYDDPFGPGPAPNMPGHDEYIHSAANFNAKAGQRILRSQSIDYCLNAYAVSRQGARKLLLASTFGSDREVDIFVLDMVLVKKISNYAVYPPLFAQWAFADELGIQNRNSDIDYLENKKRRKNNDFDRDIEYEHILKKLKMSGNVWQYRDPYNTTGLRNPILFKLKELVFEHGPAPS